jgi:hypothetical protein
VVIIRKERGIGRGETTLFEKSVEQRNKNKEEVLLETKQYPETILERSGREKVSNPYTIGTL